MMEQIVTRLCRREVLRSLWYRASLMFILLRLLSIGFVLFTIQSCHLSRKNISDQYYPVVKVVDGDTFWIDDGSERGAKVRLIGVDAPETRRSARKEIGYYGKEAKQYVTELLLGRDVRLEYDVSRKDRYGRTLAYVYLRDGTFVNALLIKEGYANVLTVPPNVEYADDFVKYQRQARASGKGLWADESNK